MNTSETIAPSGLEMLKAMVAGEVVIPGDGGYDEARRTWNLVVDLRPAVVVYAESAVDVVRAVRFARSRGMRIAPQATGHGASPVEGLEGAMLLKTARMRRVDVDAVNRVARAQAGAEWEDVTVTAGEYGLAALAGTSPNVGVTGYTLGGGMGWLSRRYGLAANSVTAVEVVTSDGRLVRADADHEPDLFWAVRGGGGSVGVVTALEMALYPVSKLYAGALWFALERGAEVLHAWRQWTDTVPDEVTSLARLLRLPAVDEVPAALRGRAFALVEAALLGDAGTGSDLLRPLRQLGPELDTFATISPPALAQLHMDPEQPTPAVGDGAFLTELPAGAIDTVLALAGPGIDTPMQSIEIRHLGGALARETPGAGAQPTIDAKYAIFAVGLTPTPELIHTTTTHVKSLKHALARWHAGYDYYNFVETPAEAEVVLPPASYERLQRSRRATTPTRRSSPPTPSARSGTEMGAIEIASQEPTLAAVWQTVAGGAIDDELLDWPPDLFALTDVILERSEAYCFALSPPRGAQWPPARVPEWPDAVVDAARRWTTGLRIKARPSLTSWPRNGTCCVREPRSGWRVSGEADEWRLCEALLTLHAIADEACAGLGVALDASEGEGLVYRAHGRELLARTGSLARIPTHFVRVLPKLRTPPDGTSLRSLARYTSVHRPGVEVRWHKVLGRRPGLKPHDKGVNRLLLPWPLRVRESDFRAVEDSVTEPFQRTVRLL